MIRHPQGSVWWATFSLPSETEETHIVLKPRPVLIISDDSFNNTHPTVTVLPITSTVPKEKWFRPVIVTSASYQETRYSYGMCDQIRTIDKKSLNDYYGMASDNEMHDVMISLKEYLGIYGGEVNMDDDTGKEAIKFDELQTLA